MTLANLDQALRLILDELLGDEAVREAGEAVCFSLTDEPYGDSPKIARAVIESLRPVMEEAMRRAYRLSEGVNELGAMLKEPPAPQACKEDEAAPASCITCGHCGHSWWTGEPRCPKCLERESRKPKRQAGPGRPRRQEKSPLRGRPF